MVRRQRNRYEIGMTEKIRLSNALASARPEAVWATPRDRSVLDKAWAADAPFSLLKIRSERKLAHAREGESFDCYQAEAAATEIAHGFHPNRKEQSSIKKGVLDVALVGATVSTLSAKSHAARR